MNARQFILVAGDAALLYASLAFALVLNTDTSLGFSEHALPFSLLFAAIILVFYAAGCYDIQRLKNTVAFSQLFITSLLVSFVLSIAFFYLFFPLFGIAPKTNLVVFFVIFAFSGYYWRTMFNMIIGSHAPTLSVVLVGTSAVADEIRDAIQSYPQLGYRLGKRLNEDGWLSALADIPQKNKRIVVLPNSLLAASPASDKIYAEAAYESVLIPLSDFYESLFKRVPLAELRPAWVAQHITNRRPAYERVVRPTERLAALGSLILLSPMLLGIAALITLTSPGGFLYRQKRVGKNGRVFTLYKFRTMRHDAEKDGAQWSKQNDPRITGVGRVLRRSHLDELPQLINIVTGEIVFVGPRPERPEFATELSEKIPYYDIRHLVAPGITGWAQIHYRYGSSVEDARRKLEFDLFYIKHRSFLLDVRVLVRTLKLFFVVIS